MMIFYHRWVKRDKAYCPIKYKASILLVRLYEIPSVHHMVVLRIYMYLLWCVELCIVNPQIKEGSK